MKAGEKDYFKNISADVMSHSMHKPFSDGPGIGALLSDIAAVFTLLPGDGSPLSILDLGCGTGWTSSFYARAGHQVVGVDISPEAVQKATEFFAHQPNLSYVCSDYDQLPYRDKFDVVIFFDSLHHAEDERDGLTAAYAALKPGGKIIICEPGRGHAKSPNSVHAVKTYGVNERDMPPMLSRKQLRSVGYASVHTYAHPALLHRALYSGSQNGVIRLLLRSNMIMRGVAAFLLSTGVTPWHGIVTAIKPTS